MFVCSIPCSLLKMPSELLIAPSGGIQLCSIISDKFYAQIGQAVLALGGQPRKARTTRLAVWRLSECSTMNQGYVCCVCVCAVCPLCIRKGWMDPLHWPLMVTYTIKVGLLINYSEDFMGHMTNWRQTHGIKGLTQIFKQTHFLISVIFWLRWISRGVTAPATQQWYGGTAVQKSLRKLNTWP